MREAAGGIAEARGGVKLFPAGLSPKAKPNSAAGIENYLKAATDPAYAFRIRPGDVYRFSVHLYTPPGTHGHLLGRGHAYRFAARAGFPVKRYG